MSNCPEGKVVRRNFHYVSPVELEEEQRTIIANKNINKRFVLFKEVFIPERYYLQGVKFVEDKYDYTFTYTGKRYNLTAEDVGIESKSKWVEQGV